MNGCSYGWSSAGRFYHAQRQIHRFLKLAGGYVDSVNTYSSTAAEDIMGRVTGMPFLKLVRDGNVGCDMLDAGVKVVFASDWVGVIEDADRSRRFEIYWRTQMFDCDGKYDANFEVLKQLTSVAGELIAESGPRNDAPGKLGVVEEGAAADLLLVDGNPLQDISVIGGRETWFSQPAPSENPIDTLRLIMKDGVIYKNTL